MYLSRGPFGLWGLRVPSLAPAERESMGKEARRSEPEDGAVDRMNERLCSISDIYLTQAFPGRSQPYVHEEKKFHSAATLQQNSALYIGYDANVDEHQNQQGASSTVPPPPGEFILPHTQLELGQPLVQTTSPYADPCFGGIMAAYGPQAMIHPHMLGMQQARMPLPSELVEEEPVYVNAKQYHGILRRRQIRAKAESENKLIKSRKPYMHESRHQHALKRARGCGGRFLNTKSKEVSSNCFRLLDRPSSSAATSRPEAGRSIAQSAFVENSTNSSSQLLKLSNGTLGSTSIDHQNQPFHLSAFHLLPQGFDDGRRVQKSNMVANGAQQKAVATQ